MITVTLSNKNKGQWFVQTFNNKKNFQAMHVDICHRCTSVLIFCKRKDSVSKLNDKNAVFAWQTPPYYGHDLRRVRRHIYRELARLTKFYEPQNIYFCGGLVNTFENDYLFLSMFKTMILPLTHLFSDSKISYVLPNINTRYTRMYMTRPNKVIFREKIKS
jgi:hypothetical protein